MIYIKHGLYENWACYFISIMHIASLLSILRTFYNTLKKEVNKVVNYLQQWNLFKETTFK